MIKVARVFLYFQVLGVGGLGLFFVAQPAAAGNLLGVSALNATGASELRGFFGGGFVALAGLMLWGLRSASARSVGGLIAAASMMGAIAAARLIGFAVDGFTLASAGAAGIEALIALSCLAVAKGERKPEDKQRRHSSEAIYTHDLSNSRRPTSCK